MGRTLATIGLVALCSLFSVGCGSRPSDAPTLVPVKGKVLIDGKPAGAGILVGFVPDASKGTKGPQSSGTTAADGTFILRGIGNEDGAVVGHHKVIVQCPFNPMMGSSGSGAAPTAPTTPCEISLKYRDPETSDVSVEIKANAADNKDVEINVTSK